MPPPSSRLRRLYRTAQDLAGRPLGQLVAGPDMAGVLVGRDPFLHECPQLFWAGVAAGLERDRRADLLAERGIRDPDDGCLGDRRVLVERFLDLARVHVVPAA